MRLADVDAQVVVVEAVLLTLAEEGKVSICCWQRLACPQLCLLNENWDCRIRLQQDSVAYVQDFEIQAWLEICMYRMSLSQIFHLALSCH